MSFYILFLELSSRSSTNDLSTTTTTTVLPPLPPNVIFHSPSPFSIEMAINSLCIREYPYTHILLSPDIHFHVCKEALCQISTLLNRITPTSQQEFLKPIISILSNSLDELWHYPTFPNIESFIASLGGESNHNNHNNHDHHHNHDCHQQLEKKSCFKKNSIKPANGLEEYSWIANAIDKCYQHPPAQSPAPSQQEQQQDEILLVSEEHFLRWDFYPPSSNSFLQSLTLSIFEKGNLLEKLDVDRECFIKFIRVIQWNYLDNPYHNFSHAVDVLQSASYVLHKIGDSTLISDLDSFSLLIAALCHDVRHGAFNNIFQENNDTLLSLLYNDKAPMESLHSMATFSIMRCPLYNFVHRWPRQKYKEFRSLVIDCILGTDMKVHFDFIEKFKTLLFPLRCGGGDLKDRSLLLVALIKFSDISNVIRPFEISKRWGFHLMQEFYHQGDWEAILGLPQSPLTRRGSLNSLAEGQIIFITKVALPLYTVMAHGFKDRLDWGLQALLSNIESWKTWKGEEGEQGGEDGLLSLQFT